MTIKSEQDLIRFIENDMWMMDMLYAAKKLELSDWWICAGFVRSKIWDMQHGFGERTKLPDIDVIYFDPTNIKSSQEKKLEKRLEMIHPGEH